MRTSLFRKLDVRAKLLFALTTVVCLFLIPTLPLLWLVAALIFLLSATQVGFRRSARNVWIIAPMVLIMAIFTPLNSRWGEALVSIGDFMLLSREALTNFLTTTARFIAISLSCSIVMQTTKGDELMCGLRAMRIPDEACLTLTLALRLIPDMSATFTQIRECQRLRLPNPDEEGTRRRPFHSIFPSLVCALVRAMRTIPKSASAIDLRGYGRGRRSHYKRLGTGTLSLLVQLVASIAIPVLVVLAARLWIHFT